MSSASAIAGRIPHTGEMCLLECIEAHDATSIRCSTLSHHRPAHPLRIDGDLRCAAGLEYAAQAMALHGALGEVGPAAPAGYLVAVRDLCCHTSRLDEDAGPLTVAAERLLGDAEQVIYRFSVRSSTRELLSGRATVILRADRPTTGPAYG